MSETGKRAVLVLVITAAVGAVLYQGFQYATTDKMIIESRIQMPPGFKSEKQRALEGQANGAQQNSSGERDLGGDLTGAGH